MEPREGDFEGKPIHGQRGRESRLRGVRSESVGSSQGPWRGALEPPRVRGVTFRARDRGRGWLSIPVPMSREGLPQGDVNSTYSTLSACQAVSSNLRAVFQQRETVLLVSKKTWGAGAHTTWRTNSRGVARSLRASP